MSGGEWTYPVLWVNALGAVWIARDLDNMTLGDKQSVASEALLTGRFFDPSLNEWKVCGAEFVGYRPYLSTWRDYPFQRVGTIALQTQALGARSLAAIQESVCKTIDRNVEFWESSASTEELKKAVRSTTCFSGLVALFSNNR